MPRDLFGQMTRPFEGVGARSRLTVPLSLAAHALAVAAVVVVPLLATDALPALHTSLSSSRWSRRWCRRRRRCRRIDPPRRPTCRPWSSRRGARSTRPTASPRSPTSCRSRPAAPDLGVIAGAIDVGDDALAPPPPHRCRSRRRQWSGRAADPAADQDPRCGAGVSGHRAGGASAGRGDHRGDDRRRRQVVDATVLRSVPLLDEAALQAVRQWRYTPTRLNGAPVAVVMTVTVNFQLR